MHPKRSGAPKVRVISARSRAHFERSRSRAEITNASRCQMRPRAVATYTFLSQWVCMRADPDGKLGEFTQLPAKVSRDFSLVQS